MYEALYYNGWVEAPAYYLLGAVEGDTPEQALQQNLTRLTAEVRSLFLLPPDEYSDEDIQETLYVLRADGLVSAGRLQKVA